MSRALISMQDHTMKIVAGIGLAVLSGELACGGEMMVVSDDLDRDEQGASASGSGGSAGSEQILMEEGLGGGTNLGAGPWQVEGSSAFYAANGRCPMLADVESAFDARFAPSRVEPQHVGQWEGFITNALDDYYPSDTVRLEIAQDGSGSIVFGSGQAPAPATQAGEGYLCNTNANPAASTCNPAGFVDGVRYELRSVVSDGIRLSLAFTADEPWSSWCELQTPRRVLTPPNRCAYGFGPEFHAYEITPAACSGITAAGEKVLVDCAYVNSLTYIGCACAEDGCIRESRVTLADIALFDEGSGLLGTLGDSLAVQFRRF